MDGRSKPWLRAVAFALAPLFLLVPIVRTTDFRAAALASIAPVLIYTAVAMWMESRAIALLVVTTRSRRDPFLLYAVPVGLTAVVAYVCSAVVFAAAFPALLRVILES